MKRRIALSILIVAIVCTLLGWMFKPCPEPVEIPVYIEVEKIVIVTVIQEVIKEVPVPEVIEVPIIKEVNRWKPYPQHFKEFDSKEHLEVWCERQVITVLFGNPDQIIDCDDYAEFFQRRALAQGYLVSAQMVENQTHMLNLTMIGNEVYFIEPQPDKFKVWLVAERD